MISGKTVGRSNRGIGVTAVVTRGVGATFFGNGYGNHFKSVAVDLDMACQAGHLLYLSGALTYPWVSVTDIAIAGCSVCAIVVAEYYVPVAVNTIVTTTWNYLADPTTCGTSL